MNPDEDPGFFERQFRHQVEEQDFSCNPFERMALEHLAGDVLDLGCGLGNLSLEAARRGHRVLAVDASPTAVARIRSDAQQEGLPVVALQADLKTWEIEESYDTIVAIGILMFFGRERAMELLDSIVGHVRPGGCAFVNVLTEGTTFMDLFNGNDFHLFRSGELEEVFGRWKVLMSRRDIFPAPGDCTKCFSTVIAQRPEQGC